MWVAPKLVARVKYGNWTEGLRLRAPVFLGMRDDISPESCTVQSSSAPSSATEAPAAVIQPEAPRPAKSSVASRLSKRAPRKKSSSFAAPEIPPKKPPRSPARPGEPVITENIEREIRDGSSENLNVEIEGQTLRLTHLNKIYFPESAIKKRDLLAYYFRIGHLMLPFLKNRPMVLRRYPNGIREKAFFQKEAPDSIPDWLDRATVYSEERGCDMPYVMANNLAALLFLTNLGCIDHNPWSSRADSQDFPDYVFFDLDPTPGTPFSTVLQIARAIHAILDSIRLNCYLKTSGASGFHIFVPLEADYTYEQTRGFAELVGRMASDELPGLITFERIVSKRPRGKVLMDALQNARGKPLATVYSARAYPGAPVSTPVTPAELKKEFAADQWTIKTLETRLKKVGNLWEDFWKNRQSLVQALELLDQKLSGRRRINPSQS
jgi:bifunctional non-homologous end joining protein LigD